MKPYTKNKIRLFGALSASIFLVSANLLASSSNSASTSTSNSFTYQGRLLNTDGSEALNDIVGGATFISSNFTNWQTLWSLYLTQRLTSESQF